MFLLGSPDMDVNALQLKVTVCTFTSTILISFLEYWAKKTEILPLSKYLETALYE